MEATILICQDCQLDNHYMDFRQPKQSDVYLSDWVQNSLFRKWADWDLPIRSWIASAETSSNFFSVSWYTSVEHIHMTYFSLGIWGFLLSSVNVKWGNELFAFRIETCAQCIKSSKKNRYWWLQDTICIFAPPPPPRPTAKQVEGMLLCTCLSMWVCLD